MRLTPEGERLLSRLIRDLPDDLTDIVRVVHDRLKVEGVFRRLKAWVRDDGCPLPLPNAGDATVDADGVPVRYRAEAYRHIYRRGYLSTELECPYHGEAQIKAWEAGRVASGRALVDRDVPGDVPRYAREAYIEGRAARRGGQGRDLNPFASIRGATGGRHRAWQRGWEEGA